MIAKTSWKRVTALALAILIGHAPSAFAGRLLDSALQAAAEVTAARPATAPERGAAIAGPSVRGAAETRAAAMQAPSGESDGGRMRPRNVWALIGAGVGIGLVMLAIDRAVEDTSPSTRRERRDGCKLLCT